MHWWVNVRISQGGSAFERNCEILYIVIVRHHLADFDTPECGHVNSCHGDSCHGNVTSYIVMLGKSLVEKLFE